MKPKLSSPKTTERAGGNGVFAGECVLTGSRNPMDAEGHWDWRNPLNVLPIGVVVVVVIALLSLML